MTKLQKRYSPAHPGLAANTIPTEGGIRYESLPQDTQQPTLMASEDQAVVSGGLASNNPYNATRYQQTPTFQVFSPVSPMEASAGQLRTATSAPQIHAPQPHRQSMDARKSVELRRLDGTPYEPEQGRKIKVAKDMHEGALPPAYQPPASGSPRIPYARMVGKTKPKQESPSQSRVSSAPHSRVASQDIPSASRSGPSSNPAVVAGPSSMPGPRRCCNKCGRMKKPATAPIQQSQFNGIPSAPRSAPLPVPPRPARPGISISHTNGMNPHIDVIPPSASTYRPNGAQSPFSQYGDETPLVSRASKQEFSVFRSLSRRLSGKDKRVSSDSGPLPSQQLRASHSPDGGEQGRLINMISKAINDSGDSNDQYNSQQYSRLSAQEQPSRPSSPFSFMETPLENEAYELKDLGDEKRKSKSPTSPDSMYSPIVIDETLDVDVDRRSKMMRSVSDDPRVSTVGALGVPGQGDDSRPPITRFKSLRNGVGRAASVTRATSLRRLESLKTVHTAWYRDDLAIDGENGESMNIPVY